MGCGSTQLLPGCCQRKVSRIVAVLTKKTQSASTLSGQAVYFSHGFDASPRCAFLDLAAGTGGRWSDELVRLIRAFVRFRVSSEPELLRNSVLLANLRRWWSLLSTAFARFRWMCRDPSVDLAF